MPILVLAATGSVYGSLLAFRAPDLRGVIAYSSLAQMGLITLGLFAFNDLGFDGAVVQMVCARARLGLAFMLAGAVERRCLTGELSRLGGLARGRPALATLVMTTGIIGLAVPGSVAFAGEFLILAGVFHAGWMRAAIGAGAIVLAAMYQLRLISAILHQEPGPAVSPAALDRPPSSPFRPARGPAARASAWPAAISEHSFPGDDAAQVVQEQSHDDAERRLVRDLALARAARWGRRRAALRRARAALAAGATWRRRGRLRVHRRLRRRGAALLEEPRGADPGRRRDDADRFGASAWADRRWRRPAPIGAGRGLVAAAEFDVLAAAGGEWSSSSRRTT